MAVSRYIEERGRGLYRLTEQQELEGIVAKIKASIYIEDKRTKEWIKCKFYLDDDYVVCGFIPKAGGMNSIIIVQYTASGSMRHPVFKGLWLDRKPEECQSK